MVKDILAELCRAPCLGQIVALRRRKDREVVKLSTERKHLTNVLKMVAYQIESDLVELVRPHYERVEDEGRTFIQMALQNTADMEPTHNLASDNASPAQLAASVANP